MARSPSPFERSLALVLPQEGGFVQDPRDPGGATNFGITRETLARARGGPASVDDVRHLTQEEAAAIYRRSYWGVIHADDLPPASTSPSSTWPYIPVPPRPCGCFKPSLRFARMGWSAP